MWRQQTFSANPDSDQSISDDDQDCPGNCVSLAASSAQKKGGVEILSRLELLKGTHESGTKTSILSLEPTSSNFEDDVEMPNFYDEGDSICPAERAVSKDVGNTMLPKHSGRQGATKSSGDAVPRFGLEKQDSSSASKEAEALMHLNEHASSYSKLNKSSKVKGKGKPRFSFRFQSHKDGPVSPSISKIQNNLSLSILEVPERLDVAELRTEENLVMELPEDIQGEEENITETMSPEVEALRYECGEQSMAELLDGLHGNTSLPRGNSEKNSSRRGKGLQLVVNKEDSPELVASCESSSDREGSDKEVEIASPKMRRQSIVDQFQEAFGATFLSDNRALLTVPQGSGLLWKLQQVMQSEKERDMEFSQKLKSGTCQHEPSCIYVKILARYLDGKLTVCDCLASNNFEGSAWSEPPSELANEQIKRTVIFNPRVTKLMDNVNVDLEVGNCVRIHPPWKEVLVGNGEIIILAAYFSNC